MTQLLSRDQRRASTSTKLAALVRAQPALALLPLRLFLGVTFTFAGLQKLADPSFFDASNPQSIQGQVRLVRGNSPIGFLLGMIVDHGVFFGVLVALTELAVGVATLLGLWARLAALAGALLSLSFFLTISWATRPYYYGSDIGFVFAWTPVILLGAPVLSLDAWRLGRPQLAPAAMVVESRRGGGGQRVVPAAPSTLDQTERDRRAFLATSGVGAAVILAAGLDAGIGRAVGGTAGATARAALTPRAGASTKAGPQAPSPSAGHPTSKAPKPVSGTTIGAASSVPVGSALQFTDPASGAPAWAVQPASGQFKAFSAICTHAGCTVAFDKGSGSFICPCHGGQYDGKTGQVVAGPPPAPLQEIPVRQSGGKLIVPEGA